MNRVLRRIRGAVGIGLLWSIPWGLMLGVLGGLATYGFLTSAGGVARLGVVLEVAVRMGLAGALTGFGVGSLFSLLLMTSARSRSLASLTVPKFATAGALASVVFSGALASPMLGSARPAAFTMFVGASALLGAWCAALSLTLAKRTPDEDEAASEAAVAQSSPPALERPSPDLDFLEARSTGRGSRADVRSSHSKRS